MAVDPRDLWIGFDLGSSSSKIVIQDYDSDRSYAIAFPEWAPKQNPYLLPTSLKESEYGVLSLARNGEASISNFKGNLINGHQKSVTYAAAYVALALRECRKKFMVDHGAEYKNKFIRWWINLGLPAENIDDQDLCETYRHIALAGWFLSERDDLLSLDIVSTTINSFLCDEHEDGIPPERVKVIPEVVAAVRGYAHSQGRDGICQ